MKSSEKGNTDGKTKKVLALKNGKEEKELEISRNWTEKHSFILSKSTL